MGSITRPFKSVRSKLFFTLCIIVLSIIFGLIAYSVSQIFVLITLFITSLFNKDLLNLFITNNQIINIDMIKLIIILSIITYTILNIIQYIVNTKLFEKGVNID